MIIVTGKFKDKTYEGEILSMDEIAKAFKITTTKEETVLEAFTKMKAWAWFDVTDQYTKAKAGQATQYATSVSIQPEYAIEVDGEPLIIRYYKTKNQKNIGGAIEVQFRPNRIFIDEGALQLKRKEQKELILFLMLHPQNLNSPTHIAGQPALFQLRMEAANATSAINFAKQDMLFREKVMNGDFAELKLRAEGMGLGNFGEFTEDEVRVKVLQAYEGAKRNGDNQAISFTNRFFSAISNIGGMIVNARTKGLIYGYVDNNKRKYCFKWTNCPNSGLDNTVFLEVPEGANPDEIIRQHFTHDDSAFKALQKVIAEHDAEENAKKEKEKPKNAPKTKE